MIGDWVYNTHNQRYEQVQEIHSGHVMLDYNDLYDYDEIEPVPLTPEILERNGFEKLSEGIFLLEDLEDNYWVKFYSKDTNYTCGVYDYIDLDCGCISIREMPIEYVHELQNALRLCGIENKIRL